MPFGKIGVLVLAVAVAVGLGGFGAALKSWVGDDPVAAIELYHEVLAEDPDNAEALTYLGWLEVRTGAATGAEDLVDQGEANLERAIEVAPGYADPHCFTAIVRFRLRDDAAAARAALDRCTAADPPQAVAGLLTDLGAEIDAALGA